MNVKIELDGTLAEYSAMDTAGGHTLHKLLIEVQGYKGNPSTFYPVEAWNDKFNATAFAIGEQVTVEAFINSREYNSRHYLEAKLASIVSYCAAQPIQHYQAPDAGSSDDVPF